MLCLYCVMNNYFWYLIFSEGRSVWTSRTYQTHCELQHRQHVLLCSLVSWKIPLRYDSNFYTYLIMWYSTKIQMFCWTTESSSSLYAVVCDVSNALSSSEQRWITEKTSETFPRFGLARLCLAGWERAASEEEQVEWSLLTSSYAGVNRREPWEDYTIMKYSDQINVISLWCVYIIREKLQLITNPRALTNH